jgi:hypothetical protein
MENQLTMNKLLLFLFLLTGTLKAQKADIAFTSFTINNNFCKGYQTKWGSLIFIPDNAFQLADGSFCSNSISIKYREIHSQTDMFYSNINMIWEENKVYKILESVGMFEIQAWCGDKQLQLKFDKQIQVRMKTRRNLKDLFSFKYNIQSATWAKYPSTITDFSYFEKRNNADSVSLWGSSRISAATATFDVESEMVYEPAKFFNKMPEGFF